MIYKLFHAKTQKPQSVLIQCFAFLAITGLFSCSSTKSAKPYELALMSADVYDCGLVEKLPAHIRPYLDFDEKQFKYTQHFDFKRINEMVKAKEWKKLAPYLVFKSSGKGGYFGRAYINVKSNRIIIAHRGTDIDLKLKNSKRIDKNLKEFLRDLDDNYDILNGNIPYQQFAAAKFFTEAVRLSYQQEYGKKNPKIIHTGHSLGAVLAELAAVEKKGRAVTFESPGSYPMVEKLLEEQKISKRKFKITTYNTVPNSINLTHPPAGKVHYLKDYDKADQNHDAYHEAAIRAALQYHSIEGILLLFNPKTGKPVKK